MRLYYMGRWCFFSSYILRTIPHVFAVIFACILLNFYLICTRVLYFAEPANGRMWAFCQTHQSSSFYWRTCAYYSSSSSSYICDERALQIDLMFVEVRIHLWVVLLLMYVGIYRLEIIYQIYQIKHIYIVIYIYREMPHAQPQVVHDGCVSALTVPTDNVMYIPTYIRCEGSITCVYLCFRRTLYIARHILDDQVGGDWEGAYIIFVYSIYSMFYVGWCIYVVLTRDGMAHTYFAMEMSTMLWTRARRVCFWETRATA